METILVLMDWFWATAEQWLALLLVKSFSLVSSDLQIIFSFPITILNIAHTELLYIYEKDVNDELRQCLYTLCSQIRKSLKRFDYYFGHFTEQQVEERIRWILAERNHSIKRCHRLSNAVRSRRWENMAWTALYMTKTRRNKKLRSSCWAETALFFNIQS